jgi:hypothetical protein
LYERFLCLFIEENFTMLGLPLELDFLGGPGSCCTCASRLAISVSTLENILRKHTKDTDYMVLAKTSVCLLSASPLGNKAKGSPR